MLRYRRRIALSAQPGGIASFHVVVNGEVVDVATHENSAEKDWTTRTLPIPERAERRATLELALSASGEMNYFLSAEAWVDAVYQLGPFGTAAKKLKEWNLKS